MSAARRKQNWDDEHRQRIDEAWKKFKYDNDEDARQFLISSYLPMVRKHARSILAKRPALLTYDDLYNAGVLGLIDAINKFDLDMKNEFYTYAPIRIKGAILDSVNALDWTPRSMRESIKAVIKATEKWLAETPNPGVLNYSNTEFVSFLMKETDQSEEKVKEALLSVSKTYVYPMYSANFLMKEGSENGNKKADGETSKIIDFVSAGQSLSGNMKIDEFLDNDEVRSAIAQVADVCNLDEKQVLLLIFWEKYTLRETAEAMGRTISWVSKTRDSAFGKLREHIARDELSF